MSENSGTPEGTAFYNLHRERLEAGKPVTLARLTGNDPRELFGSIPGDEVRSIISRQIAAWFSQGSVPGANLSACADQAKAWSGVKEAAGRRPVDAEVKLGAKVLTFLASQLSLDFAAWGPLTAAIAKAMQEDSTTPEVEVMRKAHAMAALPPLPDDWTAHWDGKPRGRKPGAADDRTGKAMKKAYARARVKASDLYPKGT